VQRLFGRREVGEGDPFRDAANGAPPAIPSIPSIRRRKAASRAPLARPSTVTVTASVRPRE
jgi:hypothetical protein